VPIDTHSHARDTTVHGEVPVVDGDLGDVITALDPTRPWATRRRSKATSRLPSFRGWPMSPIHAEILRGPAYCLGGQWAVRRPASAFGEEPTTEAAP